MLKFFWIFFLILGWASSLAAAPLPELGEPSRAIFSYRKEAAIGQEVLGALYQQAPILDDPEVMAYLGRLGKKLLSARGVDSADFRFFAIADPTLNASAFPGGIVVVHTGLIAATRNESELAGVIAHELAHVLQGHIARMVALAEQHRIPEMVGAALGMIAAIATQSNPMVAMAIPGLLAAQRMAYQKQEEAEADRVGLEILKDAGFDPFAMASFFNRLEEERRLSHVPAEPYFTTHPLTRDRIADMENRLTHARWRQVEDSLDYCLVRAKLRVLAYPGAAGVEHFAKNLQEGRFFQEFEERFALAHALMKAGRPQEAEKEYARIKNLPSAMIVGLGAQAAFAAGRLDAAFERWQEGLRRYPEDIALRLAWAKALLETGKAKQALALADEVAKLSPQNPQARHTEAEAYALLGKDVQSHEALGIAYLLEGNPKGAKEQWQIAAGLASGGSQERRRLEARLASLESGRRY